MEGEIGQGQTHSAFTFSFHFLGTVYCHMVKDPVTPGQLDHPAHDKEVGPLHSVPIWFVRFQEKFLVGPNLVNRKSVHEFKSSGFFLC